MTPARPPLTGAALVVTLSGVKQALTNAGIEVAPYNTSEFRLQEVQRAIGLLRLVEARLLTDVTITTAKESVK